MLKNMQYRVVFIILFVALPNLHYFCKMLSFIGKLPHLRAVVGQQNGKLKGNERFLNIRNV
jgi:hypothetical protein